MLRVPSAISKFYSSRQDVAMDQVVRNFLNGKSFAEQWEFGAERLKEFGELIPTDKGWLFIPFE